MAYQEFDLGRDPDAMVMSTDRRTLLQQLKEFIVSRIGTKLKLGQQPPDVESPVKSISDDSLI